MPAKVSDEEIAREVRTLRSLRRRSGSLAGPGALPLDPDLPPPSPPSHPPTASTSYSSDDDVTLFSSDGLEGDAAGLFWVPAHLHPELAPGEFRAFLKSHTHNDPEHADASDAGVSPGLARSPSWLARNVSQRRDEALGRKRSMLSRQYQPKAGDNVENEVPPLPGRQRASIYGGRSGEKGLTLEDLQKLEMLVDEAGESDDPDDMRALLRRSLSLNVAPGFLQDDIPQGGDADEPVVPPRPGSILRRSARTKIRKATLPGDGGGHRFAATRKGRMTAAAVIEIPGLEDDYYDSSTSRKMTGSDEGSGESQEQDDDRSEETSSWSDGRRQSDASTDETQIFDAYARNSRASSASTESSSRSESPSNEESPPKLNVALPPALPRLSTAGSRSDWFRDGEKTPTQETMGDPLQAYRRPSPSDEMDDRLGGAGHIPGAPAPTLQLPGGGERRAEPTSPTTPQQSRIPQYDLPPGMAAPQRSTTPTQPLSKSPPPKDQLTTAPLFRTDSATSSAASQREKEKKGGFFSKKDKKKEEKGKKDKDRFLGSLFGGNKKKSEDGAAIASNFSSAGPAAAAALLGSSKSAKSLGPSPGVSPTSATFNNFARYPIHVERAVYRLSHIKLANARRPLYEQVLISNLMFWYLGVIGRNVAEEKKTSGDEEKKESPKTPPVKGTPPKASDSGVAGRALPHPVPDHSPVSGKKTGLTKPDRGRGGSRDAEAPVRPPQYGIQNAQVTSEMRSANISKPRSPPHSQGGSMSSPPQMQQQHPAFPHQHQHQHQPYPANPQSSPSQQQPQYPQQRSNTPPAPQRALSPPAPGQHRPGEYTQSGPRDPRDGRDPRSPPPPSYEGSNPAHSNGPLSVPPTVHEARDVRQRTYSNPGPPPQAAQQSPYPAHPHHPTRAPGGPQPMRRVVSDARVGPGGPGGPPPPPPPGPPGQPPHDRREQPTSPPPQRGPQPGQIFHHPNNTTFPRPPPGQGPPPAQRYPGPPPGPQQGQQYPHTHGPPQPGQMYGRPPPPGPDPRGHPNGQRSPPTNGQRSSPQWESSQRLPPGASAPPGDYFAPAGGQVPPHLRRPGPNVPYDGRTYSYPPGSAPPPGGPGPGRASGPGMPHSQSSGPGFYASPQRPSLPQPGQIFNPYPNQHPAAPPPPRGGDEMYRRAQPVQQGGPYGHHR